MLEFAYYAVGGGGGHCNTHNQVVPLPLHRDHYSSAMIVCVCLKRICNCVSTRVFLLLRIDDVETATLTCMCLCGS